MIVVRHGAWGSFSQSTIRQRPCKCKRIRNLGKHWRHQNIQHGWNIPIIQWGSMNLVYQICPFVAALVGQFPHLGCIQRFTLVSRLCHKISINIFQGIRRNRLHSKIFYNFFCPKTYTKIGPSLSHLADLPSTPRECFLLSACIHLRFTRRLTANSTDIAELPNQTRSFGTTIDLPAEHLQCSLAISQHFDIWYIAT